jgi:hypothetical protein
MIIARALSVILAGGLLVFAGLMIGAVLWPRGAPSPTTSPAGAAAELFVQTDMGLLEAQVVLLPDLGYELDVHVQRDAGAVGQVRPTIVLAMLDMDMDPLKPSLLLLSANEFHGAGRFSMPGRWRFQLGFGKELHNFEVTVVP